jgi:peptide/nickel transport system substrate-binding protein
MMASPKVLGSSTLATTPDGTGPYTLDMAATIANDTYTYQKRSDYWNSAAYPYQTIVVKEMTPSAQVNALEAGQLTAAEFGDATSISRIEHAGISFTGGPYNVWTLFLLDRAGTLVPALKSVLVRQALNYAINRPALVKAVQLGLGKPTTQLLKPGDEGYSAALNNEYPYNPTKAKQLLAQAGYAKGFTMSTVSISTFDTATQALAGYYSAIGVTLKIVDVPPAEYISSIVGGKYPTALLPYGVIDSYYDFGQFATPNAGFNPFHTSDPVVNKLYSEAASAPAAQRPTLLEQLNARLVSQAWFVPMFSDTFGIAYTKAVKGILWKDLRPPLYYNWAPTS